MTPWSKGDTQAPLQLDVVLGPSFGFEDIEMSYGSFWELP